MGLFNKKSKNKITNYEGALSWQLEPELELYSLVCTSILSETFYEKKDDRLNRLRELIKKVTPEFIAKLSIYAREQMYLRTLPLILVVELAKIHHGDSLVSKLTTRVIQRVDELTEILAYYKIANNLTKLNKLSKQLQKGIRNAFYKFDEYQFAKYDRDNEIKLRDCLFLVHPKPRNESQKKLFEKIINRKLETPYTWEVELTKAGQLGKEKKQVWEELIDSNKVSYMALLRNLRNIIKSNMSLKHFKKVIGTIKNPEKVKQSKQFPFRFLAAYKEVEKLTTGLEPLIMEALNEAIIHSIDNIEGFDIDTKVLIACDVSGSMQVNISKKSKIQLYDIGLVLGMLLKYKCKNIVTGIFGDNWEVIQLPQKNILDNVNELYKIEGKVGYSTNGWKVIKWTLENKKEFDKIMFFTDCQLWDSSGNNEKIQDYWVKYHQKYPKSKLYLFDLQGYGTTPLRLKENNVYLISGWSDKIFTVLESIEKGNDILKFIKENINL